MMILPRGVYFSTRDAGPDSKSQRQTPSSVAAFLNGLSTGSFNEIQGLSNIPILWTNIYTYAST
jgi:hypothetical protein